MYNQNNARFNTPSFNAVPRTMEDTFKTKKRNPAKIISDVVRPDGVRHIVLEPQPIPRYSSLKFNNGYQKCQNDMKFNFWNLRSAWSSK